ncbi:DUF3800 domain-containing protein [Jiangella alkaliphila]|uniref:DUF3800 domain-containing protein n=1 Tax=Jiangella alkaliphila TaxID=419479 RepID=A0A1H2KFD9_9ACTN|nr:DUF3800 domain-containing protein [Jiangella alkaliphila]SDU67138.1 hypothetical protein SAMN04488563_3746 [Jiangella alkaliphila]
MSSWVAYVDESIRTTDGVYVLAAVILEEPDCADARARVNGLSQRGLPFHWRLELAPRRQTAVELVADLASLHLVVIGAPVNPRRQERARRQCMESLLFHLQAAGVAQVWLEARNTAADRRDIDAVDRFRSRRVIGHSIRIDHDQPSREPLLWLADIVAGTVSAAEGGEPAYRDVIAPMLTDYRIQLD